MITPYLTGSTVDRSDHIRQSPEAVLAARHDPSARLLILNELDPPLDEGELLWVSMARLPEGKDPIFLGLEHGAPRFAVGAEHAVIATPIWQAFAMLPSAQAATLAAARSLIDWHARHGFCAVCGTPTLFSRGGWMRRCPNCHAEHFPRTDPVVIMLAEHDGHVLVGRQPKFPQGRYSALAGFVEVGESVEEAVARELFEEAGLRVHDVRYLASQPWPFPSSLMIGCTAHALSNTLTLDSHELEDAMWVSREEVRGALAGSGRFIPPPPHAIARTLLEAWVG